MSNVFDNIAADGAEAPATTITTQKEKPVTQDNTNAKIVTTLKGGSGFDAPWIVIHADDVAEAVAVLRGDNIEELLKATKEVSDKFNGGQAPAQQRQAAPRTQGMPAGANEPRPSDPPMPEGWTYKAGVNKNGKAYRAYFPPRGSQESPQWLPN